MPKMSQILTDYFDLAEDFQLVDAPRPITVLPTAVDADGAVVLDPAHCVFARACERQLHKPALFLRTVAYVRQNRKKVYKYVLPSLASSIVRSFDATGTAAYDAPVMLLPPTGTRRVGHTIGGGHRPGEATYTRTPAQRAKAKRAREKMQGHQRQLVRRDA